LKFPKRKQIFNFRYYISRDEANNVTRYYAGMKVDIIVKWEGGQKATPWAMDRRRLVAQVP